jgi:hypothetical protein
MTDPVEKQPFPFKVAKDDPLVNPEAGEQEWSEEELEAFYDLIEGDHSK